MNQIERMVNLTELIKNIGPIQGERCLQKFVYLVQNCCESIGYKFTWNFFGPVSYELEQDITEAEVIGLVNVARDNNIPTFNYGSNKVNLSKFWQNKISNNKLSDNVLAHLPKLKKILASNLSNPIIMETIASILFLREKEPSSQQIDNITEISNGRINEDEISTANDLLNQLL